MKYKKIDCYLILPQLTALENSLKVISSMNRWIFIFACMAQIVSYIEYGHLLKACVSIARQLLSALWATMISIAASSIGLIAGGALDNSAATYRWTNALGVNREGAILAGTLPPAFNNTTLLLVASLGIVHLLVLHELSGAQMIVFF